MAAPTAAQVREASKIPFASLGFSAPQGDDADPLQTLVNEAVEFVEWATGRTFPSMPSQFSASAARAVRILTGVMAYQEQEDVIETIADFGFIQSFSAGNYSETRRSIADVSKSGIICNNILLHKTLWMVMTDEKRDEWQSTLTGVNAPAFETTEIAWGGWREGDDLDLYGV